MTDGPDIEKIKRNLARFIAQGKGDQIPDYLRSQGFTGDDAMVRRQWLAALQSGQQPSADAPLARGRVPSDATNVINTEGTTDPLTVKEVLRLGAAGVVPGWSDEILGALRSLDPNLTYEQAVAQEREGLASGRSKAGSTFIEVGAGLLTGAGLARAAGSRVLGPLARLVGVGGEAPSTLMGAAGRGVRTGATVGAIAGSGAADDGGLLGRAKGAILPAVAGGLLGGVAEGGLFTAANRLTRPTLDPADLRAVFGSDGPEAQRAVTEISDAMRRGNVDAGAASAAVRGGDIAPDYPLTVADADPATRTQLARVDVAARNQGATGINRQIGEFLSERAEGTAARQSAAVSRATGRRAGSPAARAEELAAQKTQVDHLMFDRARAAARERGPVRATLDLKAGLMLPDVQNAVRDVQTGMDALKAGRKSANADFVDPYLRKKGKIVGVRNDLDPATLDHLARRLGERADDLLGKTGATATQRTLGAGVSGVRQQIRDVLDVIPEFAEANAVSARFNDYRRAAEAGGKIRPRAGAEDVAFELSPYLTQTDLPLPPDVAERIAAIAGLPEGSVALPGSRAELQRSAQAARQASIEGRKSLLPENEATRAIDDLVFGPGPAAQMRQATQIEREMAQTAGASPSARGQVNPSSSESAQELAARGSLLRDLSYGVNSPRLGLALTAGDLARLGAYRAFRPTPAQLGAEATGLLATGDARDRLLRMIADTRRQFDTPLRRSLLDMGGYAAGGMPDR